jgi:uncharacterized protein (TIGR03435 family)
MIGFKLIGTVLAVVATSTVLALGQGPQQQSSKSQVFEVVSIKPSTASPDHSGVTTNKGTISMENVTLKRCIRSACNVPEAQIVCGPKWIDDERFDINAKADWPAGDQELMIMLQSVLAERFQLSFHRETKTLQGYALVVGKGGVKTKPSPPDARFGIHSNASARTAGIEAVACTMTALTKKLSEMLHLPLADLTDTNGQFDFRLDWAPDDMQAQSLASSNPDISPGASIFSAVQKQLGLKLEPRQVPVEVFAIDHAEKPSEN